MRLAGILFDKDGTLLDFDRTWGQATYPVMSSLSGGDATVVRKLAEAMHYTIETRSFLPTSPLIGGSSAQVLAAWATVLGRVGDPTLIDDLNRQFAVETLRCLMPIGDPVAVLDLLRARGHRLGLATNDAETNARAQLARLGIDGHMEFVAGYDSGHGGKPDPGMVLAFAAALGVDPACVALVGDTPHDLLAARAAGAMAIAVLSGPMPRGMLEPYADHIITSIADLPALAATLAGN